MIEHLIALTNAGHTIACSIHQPRQEIFAAFDKVLIMAEGRQVSASPGPASLHATKALPACWTWHPHGAPQACLHTHLDCVAWFHFRLWP